MYTKKDIERAFKEGFSKGIIYNGGQVDEIFRESLDSITTIGSKGKITLEVLIDYVANKYGIPADDIMYAKSKKSYLVYPRNIIAYLSYWFIDETLANIGALVGNRGHSTVSLNVKNLSGELSINRSIRQAIQSVVIDTINIGYIYEPNYTRQSGVMRENFPKWLKYTL